MNPAAMVQSLILTVSWGSPVMRCKSGITMGESEGALTVNEVGILAYGKML